MINKLPFAGAAVFTATMLAIASTPQGPLVPSASPTPVGRAASSPSTSAPPSATASPSAAPIEPGPGTWQLSKPMSVPRTEFAAVELMNGKVLLIGGKSWPTADTATVDIFDPAANTITAAASIKAARNGHSATLLPNGKVLVAGGDSRHSIG